MSSEDEDRQILSLDCLAHFNMELYYFSEILDSFSSDSPQLDHTTVNYLVKIVKIVDRLLHRQEVEKVYGSAPLVVKDFENVTLQRTFLCESCKAVIPFLWTDFQEHLEECGQGAVGGKKIKAKGNPRAKLSEQQSLVGGSKAPNEAVKLQRLPLFRESPSNHLNEPSSKKPVVDSVLKEAKMKEIKKEIKEIKHEFKKELKECKKELKECNKERKEIKKMAKEGEKKDAKKAKKTFALQKRPIWLLNNVEETIYQNMAIGEKIINLTVYKTISEDLEKILSKEFPEVKVYVFGSRKTGLSTDLGDLDLFVDVNNYYNAPLKNKEKVVNIIEKVRECLSPSNSEWSKLVPIMNARTPILKAFNMAYKIPCDLSFTSGLSHINTSLIRYLLTLQPDCHRVACFVKAWYKSIFVSTYESNKLSSYMITILVVFFMQTINLLPPIFYLQNTVEKPLMIGHWQGDFKKPTLSELNLLMSNDPKLILTGFFHFYSTFDFKNLVVCPLLGKPIERKLFETPELLPQEMARYKEFVKQLPPVPESAKDLLVTDTVMCVQDPLELCHNLAKGIHEDMYEKFTSLCAKSLAVLLQK
ncbi:terminal uridylyltransferase Tailor-like [Phlebotomus argentipes]|uniref:terminal uridylyltransferase Tailor-like n=1 Tax=Phlebotomus argentipes TaxID=94469 RepID=UPI002892B6DA|nr:terminal uridylyltransferase Tailor-like [Phlebotomus argentipes]